MLGVNSWPPGTGETLGWVRVWPPIGDTPVLSLEHGNRPRRVLSLPLHADLHYQGYKDTLRRASVGVWFLEYE
jgi:hypothetical protein